MVDIDKLTRRPAQYLTETGVPLLAGGLIWLLLGGSDLAQRHIPRSSLAEEAPHWVAICCCLVVIWGARTIKERVVFPRGGYVEPRRSVAPRSLVWVVLASCLVLSIAGLTLHRPLPFFGSRLEYPGWAIAFAIISLASAWQERSLVFMWWGVYLLCLAALLYWLPTSNHEGGSWLEVLVGGPMAVAGAIRLKRFLKRNSRPMDSTNE